MYTFFSMAPCNVSNVLTLGNDKELKNVYKCQRKEVQIKGVSNLQPEKYRKITTQKRSFFL